MHCVGSSVICVVGFYTFIWKDKWDLEQVTREELHVWLIQHVPHILDVGIKVKNMVCYRLDKNTFKIMSPG